MCPSIRCPDCSKNAYHKGVCESCGYDPVKDPNAVSHVDFFEIPLSNMDGQVYIKVDKPFKRLILASPDETTTEQLARKLGFEGPFFHTKPDPEDVFSVEMFGFEYVKQAAEALEDQWDARFA